MTVNISEIIEGIITKKVQEKAKELGIEFRVNHSEKQGLDDILLRIKRNYPTPNENWTKEDFERYEQMSKNQKVFADFAADIVIGQYANQIRFSYPSKL